jgi:hypothetical protein
MIDVETASIQTVFTPRTTAQEHWLFSPSLSKIEGLHISDRYFSGPAPSRKTICP